jgi:hypothetical protein
MTTRSDIVNRALAAISAQADIVNCAENSKEAVAARLLYDPTRQALLRAAHWNFARKTASLSLLKAAPGTPENPEAAAVAWSPEFPAPPWLYEYLVPADCQQIRTIAPLLPGASGDAAFVPACTILPQRFVLATDTNGQGQQVNVVLSNQPRAIAVYTMDVTNESLWDSQFQEAMVFGLAARFAMTIAGDKTLARMVSQQALAAVNAARVSDGNEGRNDEAWLPDWLRVRGFAGDWAGDWSTGSYTAGWTTPGFLLA